MPLKPGVRRFLEEAAERDIKMAICTSNGREMVDAVLSALKIRDFFSCVITGCEVAAGKPSPDIYLEAARRLSVKPEECAVFEDVPAGILSGKRAGMTVFAVEDDFSKKYPKMKKGATINLDDEQAYAYVHDRYGVGNEENTSRMKRQQQYMTGFFKKLQEKVKANPNYANEVFESLQDVSTTDITIGKISNISNIFASGTDKGIFELAGKSKIGQALGDEMDHMEFYVNKKAMVSTMSELFGIVEQKNKE